MPKCQLLIIFKSKYKLKLGDDNFQLRDLAPGDEQHNHSIDTIIRCIAQNRHEGCALWTNIVCYEYVNKPNQPLVQGWQMARVIVTCQTQTNVHTHKRRPHSSTTAWTDQLCASVNTLIITIAESRLKSDFLLGYTSAVSSIQYIIAPPTVRHIIVEIVDNG